MKRTSSHQILEKQTEMNERIVALRDLKIQLLSQLQAQAEQVKKVQQGLAPHHHCPILSLPEMLPEEIPENRLQCSPEALERYRLLREERYRSPILVVSKTNSNVRQQKTQSFKRAEETSRAPE